MHTAIIKQDKDTKEEGKRRVNMEGSTAGTKSSGLDDLTVARASRPVGLTVARACRSLGSVLNEAVDELPYEPNLHL